MPPNLRPRQGQTVIYNPRGQQELQNTIPASKTPRTTAPSRPVNANQKAKPPETKIVPHIEIRRASRHQPSALDSPPELPRLRPRPNRNRNAELESRQTSQARIEVKSKQKQEQKKIAKEKANETAREAAKKAPKEKSTEKPKEKLKEKLIEKPPVNRSAEPSSAQRSDRIDVITSIETGSTQAYSQTYPPNHSSSLWSIPIDHGTDTNPLQSWERDEIAALYRAYGQEPPESDGMPSTQEATPRRTTRSKSRATDQGGVLTFQPHQSFFDKGLRLRNVDLESEENPSNTEIKVQIKSLNEGCTDEVGEKHWRADLVKCETSHEIIFQHTIMMEALDRHTIGDSLDYGCEVDWTSPRPPSLRNSLHSDYVLSYPRSDLIVGFKASKLIGNLKKSSLGRLEGHMTPEVDRIMKTARAFPFLIFEAKGILAENGDIVATRQALNAASLALYNMWKFVQGEEEEEAAFFTQVKVFTVTGHHGAFRVRMHWAVHLLEGEPNRINDEDPISYHYEEIEHMAGPSYSRSNVLGIVRNILQYGKEDLLPILQRAVPKALARKQREEQREKQLEEQRKAQKANEELEARGRAEQRSSETEMPTPTPDQPGPADSAGQTGQRTNNKRGATQPGAQERSSRRRQKKNQAPDKDLPPSATSSFVGRAVDRMGLGE